jgi:aryl-alcohol dehydrogenase-like predicted oxidoreductase
VLARLVEQGKLASVGLSNWTSARIAAARRAGILPIASNQVLGNVLCRHMSPPRDPSVLRLDGMALADAEATDSSLFLFSSQCGGYLGKRLTQPDAGPAEYRNPVADAAALAIGEVARGKGVDPTNLAVAFLLAFSPNIFPIVGPRTIAQVRHSMAAARLRLTPAEIAEIARISGFSDWRQPAAD